MSTLQKDGNDAVQGVVNSRQILQGRVANEFNHCHGLKV